MEKINSAYLTPWNQRISLKTAFALVTAGICIAIVGLSALTVLYVYNQRNVIRYRYASYFYTVIDGNIVDNDYPVKDIPGIRGVLYNQPRLFIIPALILIVIVIPIVGGKLFYRWKIRTPLNILSDASEQIAGNNLEFHIEPTGEDELGKLCVSFERMRSALLESNRALWRSAEKSQQVNAAFAHDLRTPLTVMQGYGEFAEKGVQEGSLPREKLLFTIQAINRQILRLKDYTASMYDLKRLEEITLLREKSTLQELAAELKASAEILINSHQLDFQMPLKDSSLRADTNIISEVYENLLSNAIRYARDKITVKLSLKDKILALIIEDDGPGFSGKALSRAVKPYYREADEPTHLGLGLYICQILCEKHGGRLIVSNGNKGGAMLLAIFLVK